MEKCRRLIQIRQDAEELISSRDTIAHACGAIGCQWWETTCQNNRRTHRLTLVSPLSSPRLLAIICQSTYEDNYRL